MAIGARPCFVSSSRMSHLGMKPVRGGRPARDSRTRGTRGARAGTFDQEEVSMLIVVDLLMMKTIKAEKVIVT